jgi:hypothetical protein
MKAPNPETNATAGSGRPASDCCAVVCPNCGDLVPGLYSGPHEVTHCGCYHEGRGEITADTDYFWEVYEYDDHHGVRMRHNVADEATASEKP